MPLIVNIGEAGTRLPHLIARAEAGEDIVIARDGVPAARIVPLTTPIRETIALLRKERANRPKVPAEEIRAAKEAGRA